MASLALKERQVNQVQKENQDHQDLRDKQGNQEPRYNSHDGQKQSTTNK